MEKRKTQTKVSAVSIVRCGSYGKKEIEAAIKKGLKNIDFDIKRYSNKKILLKPNILGSYSPEKAITTHPEIVYAAAKMFKDAGVKVDVGETFNPFGISLSDSFVKTRIEDAAKKAGAKVVHFLPSDAYDCKNPKNVVLKSVKIPKALHEYDLIVNLPKMKTHSLTKYTGAVKNTFGFVPGGYKQTYHLYGTNEEKFCNLVLDIYQNIPKLELNIMDAVVGLEGEGPGTAGRRKPTGLILCSKNAVALDIIAAEIMCFKKDEVLTNTLAKKREIFTDKIEVVGEKVSSVKTNYKKPNSAIGGIVPMIAPFVFRIIAKKPCIRHEKCKKCLSCVKICPPKAMSFNKETKQVEIDRKKCILCYCCSEVCPHEAIELRRSKTAKTLIKIKERIFKG